MCKRQRKFRLTAAIRLLLLLAVMLSAMLVMTACDDPCQYCGKVPKSLEHHGQGICDNSGTPTPPAPTPPRPTPAPSASCAGCNQTVNTAKEHLAPCGHYSCKAEFGDYTHSAMDCGTHYHCDESVYDRDHFECEHCNEYMCEDDNVETHGMYSCGFGNHYHCGNYDVAAGGEEGYTHELFDCMEHSDCVALEMPGASTDASLHHDCEECAYCVAMGHAPGCSKYVAP